MMAAASKKRAGADAPVLGSRAVVRPIEPGTAAECAHCAQRVKFIARMKGRQVVCNVYEDGRWDRVEHYHWDCYGEAGRPYGEAA